MFPSLWVSESLGESKVNYVYIVLFFANSNEKVVWFDVSVQEMSGMHKFNALQLLHSVSYHREITYHLVSEHEHCLQREFPLAVVEQVLKTWSKQVNDHHVVVTLDSEPVNIWDSHYRQID